MSAESSIVTRA